MPRIFLAPYRFNLEDGSKGAIKEILSHLKKNIFEDLNDLTRLKCISIKEETHNHLGYIIWGLLEYGKFGTKRSVLDENGSLTKEIEEKESPMDKYFYIFNFKDEKDGFLILQRIGNVGIRTALKNAIYNYFSKNIIKIDPILLGIKDILDKNKIVDFTIEIPKIPQLIEEKLKQVKFGITNKEEIRVIISLRARRNKTIISDFFDKLISKLTKSLNENINNFSYANIGHIIDEKETLKITVRVGKSTRTINISEKKVRSWIEVEKGEDIYEKSLQLLKDIENEII